MAITLSYASATVALSDRLHWTDEFSWSPVEQAADYSITGALLLSVALKQAGRPITLAGTETAAWLTRDTCTTLHAWAALPGAVMDLVLRGAMRQVVFDHQQGGFTARPMHVLLDGELSGQDLYLPTFKFIEV